jgi:4-amino-4-deoxy-L-arabinose transferase-like glycosyltransferase
MHRSGAELRRWELWMLVAVLLLAAALRLVALDSVPPGPGYDELQNMRLAERVLEGRWAIYFPENHGQEPLYPMLEALAVRLLGRSVFSIRLPGALLGVLSVVVLCLIGRRLAGRRAALLAAAFCAISFWPLVETRMALETSLLPPLAGLAMLFLARGLGRESGPRWRGWLDLALAGIFLGGHVYAYTPGRVMLLLPLGLLAYLLAFDRVTLRRCWPGLLALCLVTALVALPLALFLRAYPEAEERLDQLGGPLAALSQGDPRPVLEIAVGTLSMFTLRGDPQWLYNVANRPVFDPLTSLFFYGGLVMCAVRLHRWRSGVLLLWLLVGLGPAFASPPAGSFTHTLSAQPAVYLVLALGVDTAWAWLAQRRAWIGPLAAALLLALNGALSCYAYFVVWADASEVQELYQGGVTAVARGLDGKDPPGPIAIGAPCVNCWHPWNVVGFDLALRRDDLSVRWFNPGGLCGSESDLGAGWIWPAGEGPTTYYFPTDPLEPQAFDSELQELFFADAELLPTEHDDFIAFRVESPTAFEDRLNALGPLSIAWPPDKAYLPPPTLPLVFDGRFALLGAELQTDVVQPGGQLRLLTYWEVLAADPTPVVAFVHLTSDGTDIWGQVDWLSVRAEGLQPDDRFVQVHLVPVVPETPPGSYHAMLGLYPPPNWQQRLPIATGVKDTADRVLLGEIQVK